MWAHAEYRAVAPGEDAAKLFHDIALPKKGSSVIDFGAGTGRGALALAAFAGLQVKMLDFAGNCLDPEIREALQSQSHMLSFHQHDLNQPVPFSAKYGFCTDVMEHIPPEEVDRVLANILKSAQHVFFQISTEEDVCGRLIEKPLHLSIHNYEWWLAKLQQFDCFVSWSDEAQSHCSFYVTAWQSAQSFIDVGVINTEEAEIRKNVEANLIAGWRQVRPYLLNDWDVMILGGGPSLETHLETIKQLRLEGVKLITLNGTYNWALEKGLKPSAQIMVDAREFNYRFTKPVSEDCRYLIASQCNPKVFEGLPPDMTMTWHTGAEHIKDLLDTYLSEWYAIPGGPTVLLRAIPLLRMLGYRRMHLFGCDSCLQDGRHHAYSQPENDEPYIIDTICGDRIFQCHAWHIAQAQSFIDLIKVLGEEIELEIHGDGLLRHILTTGAELADLKEA
ncbi:unnamed protein product [Sphagnum balticum]